MEDLLRNGLNIDLLCKIGIVLIFLIGGFMLFRFLRKKLAQCIPSSTKAKGVHPSPPEPVPKNGDPTDEDPTEPPSLLLFGRSRSETIAINAFATILHKKGVNWKDIKVGYRPECLKNPTTGRCLELDAFCPNLKVGIEYNGIQHYKFPNHIHPDTPEGKSEFEAYIARDQLKHHLAKEHGIKIIEIPYYVDTCIPDPENLGEWIYKKNTDQDKWDRIYKFIESKL